ncbi:hypothetical protein HY483_04205 [Candidatus Woesearchaeota archaeon]|nr:hypothetical protein [Candidatus Woesearchaeota archaeon]
MDEITTKFSGLDNLTNEERSELESITKYISQKASRGTNLKNFEVHIKTLSKTGQRKLFVIELHARIGRKFLTTSAEDWNLKTTLHKVFTEMKKREEKIQD